MIDFVATYAMAVYLSVVAVVGVLGISMGWLL
jgi:hypothetical protein